MNEGQKLSSRALRKRNLGEDVLPPRLKSSEMLQLSPESCYRDSLQARGSVALCGAATAIIHKRE